MPDHREAGPGAPEADTETGNRVGPAADLASAVVIGLIAAAAAALSLRIDVPDDLYTAPSLLPLLTSLTLLLMSLALGIRAVRAGGARGFCRGTRERLDAARRSPEARRALLLMGLVVLYVALVGALELELRVPTAVLDLTFSSFEMISIVVVATIMKLFWSGSAVRCLVIAALTVETIAVLFRHGFGIIMPAMF